MDHKDRLSIRAVPQTSPQVLLYDNPVSSSHMVRDGRKK